MATGTLHRYLVTVALLALCLSCMQILFFQKQCWNQNDIVAQNVYQEPATSSSKQRTDESSSGGVQVEEESYQGPQRVFPPWDIEKNPFPCVPAEKEWWSTQVLRSPAKTGILFVRNMKTASSTLGGIAIRIARSKGRKILGNSQMCKVRFDHTPAFRLNYGKRNRSKSFLFSFVRDPTRRALSQFFHMEVSRNKKEPNVYEFRRMFREQTYLVNYQLLDMGMTPLRPPGDPKQLPKNTTKFVQTVLNDYDFIGVTERIHESLVVLKMLLDLEMNDILYLPAKGSGGYDDGASPNGCTYIVPSFVTPGLKEYFASPEWRDLNTGDEMLYKAANRSLDLTINALGRQEVERQVKEYRRALRKAEKECMATAVYPCSPDGKNRHKGGPVYNDTCLWWDSGCGYKCLDNVSV